MLAIIMALLSRINLLRREVKLGITIFIFDLIALVLTETIIVASVKTLLHPAVALVGLFWIIGTACLIWFLGGVPVDTLFAARILKREIGEKFTNALTSFFFVQSAVTMFFLFVPIWAFWIGYIALFPLIVAIATSAVMENAKWNWRLSRQIGYYLLFAIIGIMIAIAVVQFFTGKTITLEWIKTNIQTNPFIALSVVALVLGVILYKSIPKTKLKGNLVKTIIVIGGLGLAYLFWPTIKEIINERSKSCPGTDKIFGFHLAADMVEPTFTGVVVKKGGKVLLTQRQTELTEICVGSKQGGKCFSSRQRILGFDNGGGQVCVRNEGGRDALIDIIAY